MHNLHGGFSWNARPCSEMPSCLIEMQKDSTRPREWAEGSQMGSCVDNWRMRNLGRRDPNQSPKTTGIWTVHSSKVKRFDGQYAPLSHVDIHNHPASKRSAFHRADWKGTSIKRPLKSREQYATHTDSRGSLNAGISQVVFPQHPYAVAIKWGKAQVKSLLGEKNCLSNVRIPQPRKWEFINPQGQGTGHAGAQLD